MRILIVNVNWLGDILFSTPAIHALRLRYPKGYLASLVVPRCAELLQLDPDLDEVMVYDETGRHRGWLGAWRLAQELRQRRFDAAILLHRSFTRTLIVWLAGIRRRIGYRTWKRGWLLTTALPPPQGVVHRVEAFLTLAEALDGLNDRPRQITYRIVIPLKTQEAAAQRLRASGLLDGDRFVVLHPGSNRIEKRWPVERYAELAECILAAWPGQVIVTGAAQDQPLGAMIVQRCRSRVIDLCGQLSLAELTAVLARSTLVIANDTGPMHLAISQGTRVIALFGPTWPQLTGPYGPGEHVVIHRGSHLEAISVDEVFQCTTRFLSSG